LRAVFDESSPERSGAEETYARFPAKNSKNSTPGRDPVVKKWPQALAAALLVLSFTRPSTSSVTAVTARTRQLIRVVTDDWNVPTGTLTRWEREADHPWKMVGSPIPVVVGSAGLGWGRGRHAAVTPDGDPVKREGDGRGPAGVFELGTAFGYAAHAKLQFPYKVLTDRSVCVDDPDAPEYNRIIEAPDRPPWKSGEQMNRMGQAYRWGVVIEHNTAPVLPSAGSCTFLHAHGRRATPTTGCTAMAPIEIQALLAWLSRRANPVLVQAPSAVYARNAAIWGAPPL
jgi:L,D-peptidoglycan transpeptidase YkuD (ErfK/YbiS/YcfS/YnhG family)